MRLTRIKFIHLDPTLLLTIMTLKMANLLRYLRKTASTQNVPGKIQKLIICLFSMEKWQSSTVFYPNLGACRYGEEGLCTSFAGMKKPQILLSLLIKTHLTHFLRPS
jgi:hypothetical protein